MSVSIIVHGIVQNVGYRKFVKKKAESVGVKGFVRNVSDGSVEMVVVGDKDIIDSFVKNIDINRNYGPQVHKIDRNDEVLSEEEFDSFTIKPTRTV